MSESQLSDCTLQAARRVRKFPTIFSKLNERVESLRLHVSTPIEGLGTSRLHISILRKGLAPSQLIGSTLRGCLGTFRLYVSTLREGLATSMNFDVVPINCWLSSKISNSDCKFSEKYHIKCHADLFSVKIT